MENLKKFIENTINELDGWIAENIQKHTQEVITSGGMLTRMISDSKKDQYLFLCPECNSTIVSLKENIYHCSVCLATFAGRQLVFEDFVVFKYYKDSTFVALKVNAEIKANTLIKISIKNISVSNAFAFKLDQLNMYFYDLDKNKKIELSDQVKAKKYIDIISSNNLGFIMNYDEIPISTLRDYTNILNLNPKYTMGQFNWKECLRHIISLMSEEDFSIKFFQSLQKQDPLLKYKSYIKEDVEHFKDIAKNIDLYKTDSIIGNKMSGRIYCSNCNEVTKFNYTKCDDIGNGSVELVKSCCNEILNTDTHFQFYSNARKEVMFPLAEHYVIDGKLVKFIYEYKKIWQKDIVESVQIKKIIVFNKGEQNAIKMESVLDEQLNGSWIQVINTKNIFKAFKQLEINLSREEIFDAIKEMERDSDFSNIIDTSEDDLRKMNGVGYITIQSHLPNTPIHHINKGSENTLYFILMNPEVLDLINYKDLKKLMDTNIVRNFSKNTESIKALTGFSEEVFNLIISDDRLIDAIDTFYILNQFKPLELEEVLKLQEEVEFLNSARDRLSAFNVNIKIILEILSKYEEVNSFRVIKRIIDYVQKEYLDIHSAAFNYKEYLEGVDGLIEIGYKETFDLYPQNIESVNNKIFALRSFLQQDNYRFGDVEEKTTLLAKDGDMELFEIKTFEDLLEIEKSFKQPISFFKKTDTSIMMLKNKDGKKALLAISLKQRVLSFSEFIVGKRKNDEIKGVLQFAVKNGELSKQEKDFINKFFSKYDVEQNCIL